MLIQKIVLLYLLVQFICINNVQASIVEEVFVTDKLCEVKAFNNSNMDKKASFIFQITIKKHASGAAYGIDFEFLNNTNRNLVITSPSNIREMFPLTITLNNRQEVSQKRKQFSMDGAENVKFNNFTIQVGAKKRWLINFKDQLQNSDAIKKQLTEDTEGYVFIYFGFMYFFDGEQCDGKYKMKSIAKAMENVHFSLESYLPPN